MWLKLWALRRTWLSVQRNKDLSPYVQFSLKFSLCYIPLKLSLQGLRRWEPTVRPSVPQRELPAVPGLSLMSPDVHGGFPLKLLSGLSLKTHIVNLWWLIFSSKLRTKNSWTCNLYLLVLHPGHNRSSHDDKFALVGMHITYIVLPWM